MLSYVLPGSCLGAKFLRKCHPPGRVFQLSLRPCKQLQQLSCPNFLSVTLNLQPHVAFLLSAFINSSCGLPNNTGEGKVNHKEPYKQPQWHSPGLCDRGCDCLLKWSPNSFGPISQKQITVRTCSPFGMGSSSLPPPPAIPFSCSLSPPVAGQSSEIF